MIRLEKHKNIERITDENERKRLINEIKASGPVLSLIKEILEERITYLESQYIGSISDPYLLAASVKTVSELKQLTHYFEATHNDSNT